MKKYRLKNYGDGVWAVQMFCSWFWAEIKAFYDEDESFNKREAEELLEKLEEK